MDLLFKRYASPFSILEGYIGMGRFCEFVDSLLRIKHKEDTYQVWLHKVFDKSYEEFIRGLETAQEICEMSDKEMETTVKQSYEILINFNPERSEDNDII